MNPLLARTLIFIAIVAAAMFIIIGVASVSHAAECEPSPKLLFIWDVAPDPCARVHHKRHHHHHARAGAKHLPAPSTKPIASLGSAVQSRTGSPILPTGATDVHWHNPEHAKLFEQFEEWMYLGRR